MTAADSLEDGSISDKTNKVIADTFHADIVNINIIKNYISNRNQ